MHLGLCYKNLYCILLLRNIEFSVLELQKKLQNVKGFHEKIFFRRIKMY